MNEGLQNLVSRKTINSESLTYILVTYVLIAHDKPLPSNLQLFY